MNVKTFVQTRRGLAAATVAVAVATAGVVGFSAESKNSQGQLKVDAAFTDASPLLVGNDVRLNGVKVGQVTGMRVVDNHADVTMELYKNALPVHQNARFTIKPLTLLGERYVDLNPGSATAPELSDGAQIPVAQTGSAVDLDQALSGLDQPTSDSLAALVGSLGTGADHNGTNIAKIVIELAPVMGDSTKLAQVLQQQNTTLGSLVTSLDRVVGGLATQDGQAMNSLVGASDSLLASTATNEAAFRQMLAQLPGTLSAAQTTLSELAGTAQAAAPTLQALRPTTSQLTGLSNDLLNFSNAADPALRAANPVLDRASALLTQLQPVSSLLRQQSSAMGVDARALASLNAKFAPRFAVVLDWIRGWALSTNGEDGLGHYFRGGLVVQAADFTGLLPGTSTGTTSGKTNSTGGLVQGLQGLTNSLLGGLKLPTLNLPLGLLAPQSSPSGSATGLSKSQEQSGLSFLLGGL